MLLQNKRVLVIEDDITNIAVMSVILKQYGALVTFERWGAIRRETLTRFLPLDVILLDLMFPHNVSGYQVFDAIRSIPELSGVPIVAVTAADPDIEMPKARERGFSGFISKPVRLSTFGQHIAQILDGEQVWLPENKTS